MLLDASAPLSLSTGHNSAQTESPFRLTGTQLKTKRCIEINVDRMAREVGAGRVGFLTLTVGDDSENGFVQVSEMDEANRRVNNLARRFLPSLFARWVIVTERHRERDGKRAIHFHLCVELPFECREGYDWQAVRDGDYSSANDRLRALWKVLRDELPKFGFGRAQLEPAKGAESLAAYVAKYVEKNLFNRPDEDKGRRLVRYGGWNKTHCRPCDIAWATPRAALWRNQAQELAAHADIYCLTDVQRFFGPKWAYRFTKIMGAPVHQHSSWVEIAMKRHVSETTEKRMAETVVDAETWAEIEIERAWAGMEVAA